MHISTTGSINVTQRIEELLKLFAERKKNRDVECSSLGIEAFELAKESRDNDLLARTGTSLAYFYTEITSEFPKAIAVLREVITYLQDEADAEVKSEFYRRIGLNNDYLGEFIKSKQAYDESIRLLQNRTQLSEEGNLTLARSLFNLSIIYNNLGLDSLSENHLKLAFDNFQKAHNQGGIARCYISFGVALHEKQGDMNEVLDYYRKAADIAKAINDDPPYCVAMGNIGIVSAETGDFKTALESVASALEVARRSVNKHFLFSLHRQAGRIYQLMKDYESADNWYREGEKIFLEMGSTLDHYEFYRYWAETLAAADRHKEAYEKLTKFTEQKDKLHKINKEAAVTDAMLRFQVEEGRKEQELLKRKNSEIEEYARQLEASNHELNQFAYVASHDMKEPLRMISNYSQLLTRSYGDDLSMQQSTYLNYINEGAKRMMNIINSILQLSKINMVNKPDAVNLNEVLEEVKQSLGLQIVEKAALIKNNKLPVIYTDRLQIGQLFQNLISNALKYNESHAAIVDIEHSEHDDHYRFEFADNGIGIDPKYRDKVFIIFQRLHSREQFEGTGIGLAICKKIVDNMKGKIWIEDSPLGGTKFCITIPK
ncbi:MAG: ATP-binding protein [Chitinophagales bacterium]